MSYDPLFDAAHKAVDDVLGEGEYARLNANNPGVPRELRDKLKVATVPMPARIARLPRDRRGYPVPWNVLAGTDGKPIFTVNDMDKHAQALRWKLCPICGERLGKWRWFVGGILSAFDPQGAYYDLPGHKECESFALQVCPYLAAPQYLGRIDVPDKSKIPDDAVLVDVTMIPERPEIFVAVASDHMEIGLTDTTPTVRPVRPYLDVMFWRHGQQLTIEEAYPALRAKLGPDWTLPALRL